MPAVAAGHAWTAAEAAHLAACADCRTEWALVERAAGLGQSLALAREPEAIARAVLDRVAAAKRDDRRRGQLLRRAAGLAAAACIALAAWATLHRPYRGPTDWDPGPAPIAGVETASLPDSSAALRLDLAELDGLSAGELQELFDRMDPPLSTGHTVDPSRAGDLTQDELERLLRSLEG
jgi:hypothetical protein